MSGSATSRHGQVEIILRTRRRQCSHVQSLGSMSVFYDGCLHSPFVGKGKTEGSAAAVLSPKSSTFEIDAWKQQNSDLPADGLANGVGPP